jgi:autophagy-related protein 2
MNFAQADIGFLPLRAIETEIQVEHLDVLVKLHDGYDWNSTRQTIEQARKTMRKRLQKIRQLLATGNPADDARSMEEDLGPTTLFKSLHIGGLDSSTRGLSTAQLLDAIDDQLGKEAIEPVSDETESMAGSWQSLNPHPSKDQPYPRVVSAPSAKQHHLSRSPLPMLKIVLNRVQGHFRKYYHDRQSEEANTHESTDCRLSSLQLKTDSLTIIDNIPTSTWKKFLTELRPGEGGMLRPTGAPMARFKLVVTPSARDSALKEAVVKLKISPLRLYVDQDAVDFLKTFLSFQKHAPPAPSSVSISAIPDPSTAPPADGLFFRQLFCLSGLNSSF